MTTNFLEKLALIRPGRFDITVNFTKCKKEMIVDMLTYYYDCNILEEEYSNRILALEDYVISPAELSKVLFENFGNLANAVTSLEKIEKKHIEEREKREEQKRLEREKREKEQEKQNTLETNEENNNCRLLEKIKLKMEVGKTEVGKTEIGKTEVGKTEVNKTNNLSDTNNIERKNINSSKPKIVKKEVKNEKNDNLLTDLSAFDMYQNNNELFKNVSNLDIISNSNLDIISYNDTKEIENNEHYQGFEVSNVYGIISVE